MRLASLEAGYLASRALLLQAGGLSNSQPSAPDKTLEVISPLGWSAGTPRG